MCFVHGIKDRILYLYGWDTLLYKSVIMWQTLFFIQEFLKAITRSQEKEDWNPYNPQSIELSSFKVGGSTGFFMGSTSQVWGLTASELFPSPSFWLNDFSSCKCVDDVCRIRCYEAFNGLIQNWEGDLQFYEHGNFLLAFISVPRLLIGFLYVIYDIYRLFNGIFQWSSFSCEHALPPLGILE